MRHVDEEDFLKDFLNLNVQNYGYGSTPVNSLYTAAPYSGQDNAESIGRQTGPSSAHKHPSNHCSSSDCFLSALSSPKQLGSARLMIDEIRSHELRRLHGQAYLDYGGSALYSERQLEEALENLKNNLTLNPHRCSIGPLLTPSNVLRVTLTLQQQKYSQFEINLCYMHVWLVHLPQSTLLC
jgi:hypothetical protein